MKCNRSFYNRDTCQVAQDLLGRYLIRMQDGRPLVIRITETEAYIGRIDKACHAYNRYLKLAPGGKFANDAKMLSQAACN